MTYAISRFSRRWAIATIAIALAAPAAGQQRQLDGPRAAGQVGERFDGYAMVHGAAPADVQALVQQVNAKRHAIYQEKAAAQQVPVEAIGRIYAAEIIRRLPAGSWVYREDGQWTRK